METVKLICASVIFLSSIYLIGLGLIMETKNVRSAFVFKIAPVLLGLSLVFVGLYWLGFIVKL